MSGYLANTLTLVQISSYCVGRFLRVFTRSPLCHNIIPNILIFPVLFGRYTSRTVLPTCLHCSSSARFTASSTNCVRVSWLLQPVWANQLFEIQFRWPWISTYFLIDCHFFSWALAYFRCSSSERFTAYWPITFVFFTSSIWFCWSVIPHLLTVLLRFFLYIFSSNQSNSSSATSTGGSRRLNSSSRSHSSPSAPHLWSSPIDCWAKRGRDSKQFTSTLPPPPLSI